MNVDEKEEAQIRAAIKRIDTFIVSAIVAIGCFVAGVYVGSYTSKESTPVENNHVIDSLSQVNDSIKLKVEKLDSIKDAKVIEVSTLDNDSTLKLFYKLVSE